VVTELIDYSHLLLGLMLFLAVYGFFPRLALRIIVLLWHPEDPRRDELLAEFHIVPTRHRPIWVAEQLEAAIFEGLSKRIAWALTGPLIYRWRLESGVKMNRKYPDTFWIPSDEEKRDIKVGDHVRLIFEMSEQWGRGRWGERMWVNVEEINDRRLMGTLRNTPAGIPKLNPGDRIKFTMDDVIDVIYDPEVDDLQSRPDRAPVPDN
jgi:Uncharacterized protein conserved in bacteria (DUF2314)